MPLWNAILGMSHWQRATFKKKQMADFLSALKASAADSLTKTGSVKSIWSIAADTLASYRTMRLESAKSKRRSAKPQKAKKNTR